MSSAQAMQEELQQSIVLSEGDAEHEEEDQDNMELDRPPVPGDDRKENTPGNGRRRQPRAPRASKNDTDEEFQDALDDQSIGGDADSALSEAEDDLSQSNNGDDSSASGDDDEKEDASMGEADADADDDEEELATQTQLSQYDERDDDEEDDAEGVGAVKIRPGDTDDESGDSASIASAASSDHESEAEWEGPAENDNEDEDEGSEVADLNLCLFCKKPEENDPSDDFEAFLACSSCGDHGRLSSSFYPISPLQQITNCTYAAHQQCTRDAGAMNSQNGKLHLHVRT